MKSDFHLARTLLLLVVLPAGLIFFAWQMSTVAADGMARADARAALPSAEEAAEMARLRAVDELQPLLAERRDRAQRCVSQGMRSVDGLSDDAAVLVLLSGPSCATGCATESIATELASSYYLEGLRVLLIRTSSANPGQPPPGVYTVVMPACATLIAAHGDDYFFRSRTGQVSSSGARHEQLMQIEAERSALAEPTDEALPELPFNPEATVRKALDLPPK